MSMQQAIDLFDRQQYTEAFAAFVDTYQTSADQQEKQDILQMLTEAYYAPNEEELRKKYENNVELLKEYPYVWEKNFCRFEGLKIRLFPVDEETFYCFDREENSFSGVYDAKSKNRMRYFFEKLDDPLQVQDEDNLYNLTFLNDNVRASEDYAGDNHIYLLYSSQKVLERLMLACDLRSVLQQQKFVFLIGEENWKRYPIDFKECFQTDYAAMGPQPIRIEEIKRFCYWYKHAHSGTGLSRDVLGAVDEIQAHTGHDFNVYSTVDGKVLYDSPEFRTAISDVDRYYTVEQVANMASSERYHFRSYRLDEYLDWLRQRRAAPHRYTVKELFCGYFLFLYEKRNLNPRIAPMLLYDPHVWDPSAYNNLVFSFPYHTVLTCVREPIMTFARCQMIGIVGWDEFSTKYMLAFDYAHTQFLHPDLLSKYYGYRFEDLKTKPEMVCRAICKHLDVPFESKMLEVESPADNSGHDVRGFDTAPLHWDISAVMSEFDIVRLKMFYEPIHAYYGYPTFSCKEHPMPEKMVRELFSIPFRFEYVNPFIYGENAPSWDSLHSWIQEILQNAWRKRFVSPKLIPLEDL